MPTELLFLVPALALIATILWQISSRRAAVKDRELEALRQRLGAVSELTSALNQLGDAYSELSAVARLGLDPGEASIAVKKSIDADSKMREALGNPDYDILRLQLSEKVDRAISRVFRANMSLIEHFAEKYMDLRPDNPEFKSLVAQMEKDAEQIAQTTSRLAALISKAFANLERHMAK